MDIYTTDPDLAPHVEEIKFTTRSSPGALRPWTTTLSRDRGPQASFQALPPPRPHSLLGAPTCPCSCHDDITCVDGVGVGQPGGGGEHSHPRAWLLSWDPLSRPQTGPTLPMLLVLCTQTGTR